MVAPTKGDESVQANPSNQSGQSAFLSGKMSQVDVKAIQSELNKLWQNASTAKPGEDVPQIVRACSTNLILYTDRPDAETDDSAILDELVQIHPACGSLTIF